MPTLLVTGASRGIGREFVRQYAAEGWRVIAGCRDPGAVGAALRAFGGGVRPVAMEVTDAASVEADRTRIGLKGSWTQVHHLFSPSEARTKACQFVSDPAELVTRIKSAYEHAGPGVTVSCDDEPYVIGDREPTYHGQFWVYAEPEGEAVRAVSLELVGVARGLANCLGEKVGAVLATDDVGDRPAALIAAGADVVYVLEDPLLAGFDPVAHKEALAALVVERKPQAMLFGATPLGRELAPRVAYACRCGLTADCTQLRIGDYQKGATNLVAILEQTRPALGGNVMATIMTKDSQTQMATVRPGVFKMPQADPGRSGFCWLSCGAHPVSAMTSKVAGIRPPSSA